MGAMKAGEVVGVGDDGATDEDGAADPGAWVGLESSVHSGGRVDSCWGGLEETSEAGSEDSDEHEAKEAKGKPSHGMSRFHWCHCFMPHGIKARATRACALARASRALLAVGAGAQRLVGL